MYYPRLRRFRLCGLSAGTLLVVSGSAVACCAEDVLDAELFAGMSLFASTPVLSVEERLVDVVVSATTV